MNVDGDTVTYEDLPDGLDIDIDTKVATPFGETKPAHASKKGAAR